MNRPTALILTTHLVLIAWCAPAAALERFPPPQFETNYQMPSPTTPPPRADVMEYVDLAVLLGGLCVAAYLVLRKRSRRWIFLLMLISLGYFGFYRKGCVCAIGSIQNVAAAIFAGGYSIPLTALGFFLFPLVFTLLFGRVFCGAVCPLGAIQDVVLLRPVKVPEWIAHALGMLGWVFLTAAVLFAATGSVFLICRYDPFVGFFRLGAEMTMLALGASLLLVGVFVARPYCRFLCPLGALMHPLSKLSKFRVTITPDECVQCRLCENSCPFGAILKPTDPLPHRDRGASLRRVGMFVVLLPLMVAGGALLGSKASGTLGKMHYTVRLSERLRAEEAGTVTGSTDATDAFRKTARTSESLYEAAEAKQRQFTFGGVLAGGFLGLVFAGKLLALCLHRTRTDYQPDRAHCLSCGRCFEYCPLEKQRRKGKQVQLKKHTQDRHDR